MNFFKKNKKDKTAAIIDLHRRLALFNIEYNDHLALTQIIDNEIPVIQHDAVKLRCALIIEVIDDKTINFKKNTFSQPGVYNKIDRIFRGLSCWYQCE